MKTPKELIESLHVNAGNLQHIAVSGKINGSLLADIERIMLEYAEQFKEGNWKIDKVDRYWYWSSRNGKTYVEVTYWYEPCSCERKETRRTIYNYYGEEHTLPDWAKGITENRKSLNDDRIY